MSAGRQLLGYKAQAIPATRKAGSLGPRPCPIGLLRSSARFLEVAMRQHLPRRQPLRRVVAQALPEQVDGITAEPKNGFFHSKSHQPRASERPHLRKIRVAPAREALLEVFQSGYPGPNLHKGVENILIHGMASSSGVPSILKILKIESISSAPQPNSRFQRHHFTSLNPTKW